MNTKQEYIDKLDTINNTIIDTKFILDDGKPYKGIYKTLFFWILSVFLSSIIISIIPYFALTYAWVEFEIYYTIFRIIYIVLFTIPILVYFISTKRMEMTLKELNFLNTFSFIPILISFFKLLTPLSYYLNVDFLLTLYNVIPIDFLLLGLGIHLLNCYFDLKSLKYISISSMIYIILFSFVNIMTYKQTEITNSMITLIKIKNILEIINSFSIALFIFTLLTLYIVRHAYEQ